MQRNLFEINNDQVGFRLHRLEMYNWGTFNKKIWSIEPDGYTSLLTGFNGSGKSTVVDALLTLLVPNIKRNYNLASIGTEKRRERDEKTYVLGAYGRLKDEVDQNTSKVQYLRTKDDYSVLLAYFFNQDYQHKVTLAQVFWFENDSIRKFFLISEKEMNIKEHFNNVSSIRDLKKKLNANENTKLYDQFIDYSAAFRRIFGSLSEKALDLFNQTVAIKVIGDLNDFLRNYMLEKLDVNEKISELKKNYVNLTKSYDAIQKAEKQLQLLKPLINEANEFETLSSGIRESENCLRVLSAFFSKIKIDLFNKATIDKQYQLSQIKNQIITLNMELENLRQIEKELNIAINKDEIGQHIENIEKEIKYRQEELERKKKNAEKYISLANRLKYNPEPDENGFYASLSDGCLFKKSIEEQLQNLILQRDGLKFELKQLEDKYKENNIELQSLKQRKNQIPNKNLEIRKRISAFLEIPDQELPFIGELLKVKDTEKDWEGAIERLLHNFGLRILVPEIHYNRFNSYVNKTDLRGKIIYNNVILKNDYKSYRELDSDEICNKIELKPDTEFHGWLKNQLIEHYNHICCADLEHFQRELNALTKSGLIKGKTLHIKDDTTNIFERRNYILGWNNQEKINAIQNDLSDLQIKINQISESIRTVEREQNQLNRKKEILQDFTNYKDFTEIGWKRIETDIGNLMQQKKKLMESSDKLKQLQKELDSIKTKQKDADLLRNESTKKEANLERDIREYQKYLVSSQELLKYHKDEEILLYSSKIEPYLQGKAIIIETVEKLEDDIRNIFQNQIKQKGDKAKKTEKAIEKMMSDYIRDNPEETTEVIPNIDFINEFKKFLNKIEREDLPRHKKRFKELLNENVIRDIASFQSILESQEEDIKAKIEALNQSLVTIDYSISTFIILVSKSNRDAEIRTFRLMLKDCLPDIGRVDSPESNEASFHKIRKIIEQFDKEQRWTEKVTDVRNWLDFAASERYKTNNLEKNHYSDSSGLSGGQKAKLAYTILASAIAYQFGLDSHQIKSKSFRFVAIDEAFSKSDEANSRHAMELFKKLNLQLLVVTPHDKIHIVEPYISAVHYVENNQDLNNSKVHTLTMQEYTERKKEFKDLHP
ncbi:MAG: hypothetical protein OIN86_16300 [Candidatus Methanoperedens sp.]|nr:hypothetical protein [Candidatus Methanoperedens sp.]CAG0989763.1 hypothetical protein METP1_02234 [Methanosarcinales archaeon]